MTEQLEADALAVASPSAVTWLTGFAPEIETGPSPFALSPIAILGAGPTPILVVSEDEAEAAAATGCTVATYAGFGIGSLDPVGGAGRAFAALLDGPRLAIDAGAFPAALVRDLDWVDATDALSRERVVKDPDEIEAIRASIAVCDAGQAAARSGARPGMSELDLWAHVRGALERAAGGRIPVLADLVSGPRTTEVGGPPGSRILAEGDIVLCDLVPRVAGYWGDSCASFVVGEPTDAAREAHERVRDALAQVVAAIRPGAVAGELDALARGSLDFPHHTGHGLGTTAHEEPRLVPSSPMVLEEGMVVAIEPGSYAGLGLRLEQVVLVTADGCEILSGHDLGL